MLKPGLVVDKRPSPLALGEFPNPIQDMQILLYDCKITEVGCAALTSALKSNPSHLIDLDLSENEVGDAGVEKLSDLLKCNFGKQQKLKLLKSPDAEEAYKLNGNGITEESCAALASALHSNPLYLRKLDLSGNKVGKSGMEKLGILLESPKCELDKL
ncbi:hypothetical protein NFI96_006101, partial [Prochilodus magdalenae]